MTFNKKINAKNAFEVNIEYLENLPRMLNHQREESWQTASNGLEAVAQIYSYRVDSVHTDLFKILGGLHRNMDDLKEEGEDNTEKAKESKKKRSKNLEENKEKLNLKEFDIAFQIDPLFKNTTTMFSHLNARSLLQFCLEINDNLDLVLEGSTCVNSDEMKEKNAAAIGQINFKPSEPNNNAQNNFKSPHKSNTIEANNINNINNINFIGSKAKGSDDKVNDPEKSLLNLIDAFNQGFHLDSDEKNLPDLPLCSDLEYFKKGGKLGTDDEANEKIKSNKKHNNDLISKENEFLAKYQMEIDSSSEGELADRYKMKRTDSESSFTNKVNRIQDNDMLEIDDAPDNDVNINNIDNSSFHEYNNANEINDGVNSMGEIDKNNISNFNDYSSNNNNYPIESNKASILMFKPNELKEHLSKFGAGDLNIIQPPKNLNLNNKGKNNWDLGGVKKEIKQKQRKEQKLFNFTDFFSQDRILAKESEEELYDTLFAIKKEPKKKAKTNLAQKENKRLEKMKKRRKVYENYNHQKSMIITQFTNNLKIAIVKTGLDNIMEESNDYNINNPENDDNNNNLNNEDNKANGNLDDAYDNFDITHEYTDMPDLNRVNAINTSSQTYKFNSNNSQNRIEQLYRIFDVRKIKNKLWDTIQKVNTNNIQPKNAKNKVANQGKDSSDFHNIINTMVTTENISNVSSATSFVCLLHLCNEKGKFHRFNIFNIMVYFYTKISFCFRPLFTAN